MLPDTHTRRVLGLASQRGLLRASDLDAIDAPRVVLTRLTAAGLLEKIGRGLYRLPDSQWSEHESLLTVATKVPQAVFCLLTALQFHELTTQLPRQVWIAMPRGSHTPRFDYPPIKMVQFTGDAYTAGIEEFERDGVKLRVYGVAKTVVDCFKHRNKIAEKEQKNRSAWPFMPGRCSSTPTAAKCSPLKRRSRRFSIPWWALLPPSPKNRRPPVSQSKTTGKVPPAPFF